MSLTMKRVYNVIGWFFQSIAHVLVRDLTNSYWHQEDEINEIYSDETYGNIGLTTTELGEQDCDTNNLTTNDVVSKMIETTFEDVAIYEETDDVVNEMRESVFEDVADGEGQKGEFNEIHSSEIYDVDTCIEILSEGNPESELISTSENSIKISCKQNSDLLLVKLENDLSRNNQIQNESYFEENASGDSPTKFIECEPDLSCKLNENLSKGCETSARHSSTIQHQTTCNDSNSIIGQKCTDKLLKTNCVSEENTFKIGKCQSIDESLGNIPMPFLFQDKLEVMTDNLITSNSISGHNSEPIFEDKNPTDNEKLPLLVEHIASTSNQSVVKNNSSNNVQQWLSEPNGFLENLSDIDSTCYDEQWLKKILSRCNETDENSNAKTGYELCNCSKELPCLQNVDWDEGDQMVTSEHMDSVETGSVSDWLYKATHAVCLLPTDDFISNSEEHGQVLQLEQSTENCTFETIEKTLFVNQWVNDTQKYCSTNSPKFGCGDTSLFSMD